VTAQVEPPKNKRGRETVGDMVRSLGIVLGIVVVAYWLAQPPDSDKKEYRQVDPAVEIRSFVRAQPGAPVPGTLPAQWVPTVAVYKASPDNLRVGYYLPDRDAYAEYFASAGSAQDFLREAAGEELEELDPVQVGAVTWQQVRDEDGSLSLHRTVGGLTVVVGSLRSTVGLDELRVLAGSLATG
jgi:hypothetical protein